MCKNESNDFDRRLIYISDHFIWQLQFEAYVTKHVLMYPLFPKMDWSLFTEWLLTCTYLEQLKHSSTFWIMA